MESSIGIKRIESQYGENKLMITGKASRYGDGHVDVAVNKLGVISILCIEWCHLRCSELKKVREVQGFQCHFAKKG